jgi:hypothetical protein
MQTAGQIITRACQAAKVPGYTAQAAGLLNAILADLCETRDLAVARGFFSFNFDTNANSMLGGQNIFSSGPYPLPLDYLRTSGSSGSTGTQRSTTWFIFGVPYPMVPCDLAEFDGQVQQAGLNSYPWLWATDMSKRIIAGPATADAEPGSNIITWSFLDQPTVPEDTLGMTVQNDALPIGTTVIGRSSTSITVSNPATAYVTQGTFDLGFPGVGYAYPPPSGNFPVNLRYQRQMPDLATDASGNLTPAASMTVPWFPHIDYLEQELTGRLMRIADDSRVVEYLGDGMRPGRADKVLGNYLRLKDDDTNRAQTIEFDRRRFGSSWQRLKTTKTIGW